MEALNKLALHNTVHISWVPGHCKIWGNEQADVLAKTGLTSNNKHKGYLPQSFIKKAIDEKVALLDEQRWESHGTKHTNLTINNTKNHITHLNKTFQNNRHNYSTIIRVMTGFIGLNYHLHKINLSPTNLCPKCNMEAETVDHFIGKCPAFSLIRLECLDTHSSPLAHIFEANSLSSILRYIHRTKRLQFDPLHKKTGVT